MSSSFFNDLNNLLSSFSEGDANNTNTTRETCPGKINHYLFYQFTLIPAVLISLSFAVTKQRRNILLQVWNGRPGLIFPMDTLTRSSRMSYCCCFGTTASLVLRIILERTYAINYSHPNKAVTAFIMVLSMFIYGLVFFPVFTTLAVGSVYGYVLGGLYVWMLTGVEFYRLFECHAFNLEARLVLILRALPQLVCLLYLSVSLPVRLIQACQRGQYFHWKVVDSDSITLRDIRDSYAGHHVAKLFRKPKFKLPPETRKGWIIGLLTSLARRFIYQRQKGFRYPARLLSVLFVALLIVYMLTIQFLVLSIIEMDLYKKQLRLFIEVTYGLDAIPGESDEVAITRQLMWWGYWLLDTARICFVVTTALVTLFAVLNALHTLSSYRIDLLALYRGDHSRIPPASRYSNTSHCVNSIKYAGFQVGYIIWCYLIQWLLLLLVNFFLALCIYMFMLDVTAWLIFILQWAWPFVLVTVIVMVVQIVLAKFVFLQEKGQYLALNNRNVYFNFTYFMFFYNIFLGLVSCILRILKAMLLGIAFLGRLDTSTLSRRFEFFDPGFRAYMGYMQVEASHTHPVVIIFCRLMLLGLSTKREREEKKKEKKTPPGEKPHHHHIALSVCSEGLEMVTRSNRVENHDATSGDATTTTIPIQDTPSAATFSDLDEQARRRSVAARFNWHVTYTLLMNPDIRVMRKGYIHMLKQAQLMGVYVPVSDRQADVNFDQLQERLAEAKLMFNPPSKKKKKEEEKGEGGGHGEEPDVEEAMRMVKNGDVKKAMSVSPTAVLVAQVTPATAPLATTPGPQEQQGEEKANSSVAGNSMTHKPTDTPASEEAGDKQLPSSVQVDEDVPSVRMSHGALPEDHHTGQSSAQQGGETSQSAARSPGKYVSTIKL